MLKKLASGFIISLLIIFVLYKIEIVPEIEKTNLTIKKNENYISNLRNNNFDNFLFNDKYNKDDFEADFHLLNQIYLAKYDKNKEKVWVSQYPEILWKSVITEFNEIVYLHTKYPNFSYDTLVEKKILLVNKTLLLNEDKKIKQVLDDNRKFLQENFKKQDEIIVLSRNNALFMDRYFYDDLIKVFNKKYKNNSIIEGLIVKSSDMTESMKNNDKIAKNSEEYIYKLLKKEYLNKQEKEEFKVYSEKRKRVDLLIGNALLNNDKEKLNIYFKQIREYLRFLNGFDLPSYDKNTIEINSSWEDIKKNIALNIMLVETSKRYEDYLKIYLLGQ